MGLAGCEGMQLYNNMQVWMCECVHETDFKIINTFFSTLKKKPINQKQSRKTKKFIKFCTLGTHATTVYAKAWGPDIISNSNLNKK